MTCSWHQHQNAEYSLISVNEIENYHIYQLDKGLSCKGAKLVLKLTAVVCQRTTIPVTKIRICWSDLPARLSAAQSQLRKKPFSVIRTMRMPVELMRPMLKKVFCQWVLIVSVATRKCAIAALRLSINRGWAIAQTDKCCVHSGARIAFL